VAKAAASPCDDHDDHDDQDIFGRKLVSQVTGQDYSLQVAGRVEACQEEVDLWLINQFFKTHAGVHQLDLIAHFTDRIDWSDLLISLLLQ